MFRKDQNNFFFSWNLIVEKERKEEDFSFSSDLAVIERHHETLEVTLRIESVTSRYIENS